MKPCDVGYATAIASLSGVGPARLRVLLEAGEPHEVWTRIGEGSLQGDDAVVAGLGSRAPSLCARWRDEARRIDPTECSRRGTDLGLSLLDAADPRYPAAFRADVEPPSLLWVAGDPECIHGPTVAIVGTRRCTRYGHDVARRLGAELTASGVSVVSGLALGIDAAAHAGALEVGDPVAAPVGVVGTGLDVVYPRRNRGLWDQVRERGVLMSEAPPGATAEPWRFPARNRLIAALADAVVVVESTEQGGSLYTVDEAMTRDVSVWAVPGPITSPTSVGTNRLLADGASPLLDVADLLDALGLSRPPPGGAPDGRESGAYRDPSETQVLDLLTVGSMTFDELAERSGLSLERLGLVTARLLAEGVVARSGGWYERRG